MNKKGKLFLIKIGLLQGIGFFINHVRDALPLAALPA